MVKNLYVGNLPWDTSTDELFTLFQEHGAVTHARVVHDRVTGRPHGFGFVEMANDDEALHAIAVLNRADFRGRPLTVNEAKPREGR